LAKSKETLSQKRRRAAYQRQRNLHAQKRQKPTRREYRLGQAIHKGGWSVLGYEYEVQDGERFYWYNAAIQIGDKIIMVDLPNEGTESMKRMKRHLAEKAQICKDHNWGLIIIKGRTVQDMQAEIELEAIKIRLMEKAHADRSENDPN